MVLLDVYGKISPTIISKKLGVGICNPSPDWVDGLQDDFREEILIHNHFIASFKKDGSVPHMAIGQYDLKK